MSLKDQEQVPSRHYACGHVRSRSTEAQLVQSVKEYQDGVILPFWDNRLLDVDQPGNQDANDAAVGVREYQEYAESREVLFAMFPQLDTEVLEDTARKHASEKRSDLVEAMEKFSTMAERLEKEIAAHNPPSTSTDQLPTPTSTPSTSSSSPSQGSSSTPSDIISHCKYFQVKVENKSLSDSETCKPGWDLAQYMLAEYDKAGGHRYADHLKDTLHRITVVQNSMLEARFRQSRNRLEKQAGGSMQKEYILYHGTGVKNALSITRNGFYKSKIKSQPKGFYLATWPEMPLQYGKFRRLKVWPSLSAQMESDNDNETVMLVCKVLLECWYRYYTDINVGGTSTISMGVVQMASGSHIGRVRIQAKPEYLDRSVRLEADGIAFNPKLGRQEFVDCDSMLRIHPLGTYPKNPPHKPVAKCVFILPEPDQILPVGLFHYNTSASKHHPGNDIPSPDATASSNRSEHLTSKRVVSPSLLDMTQVRVVLERLKPMEHSEDAKRRIKFFEDMVEAYEKRDLCVKCGFANSKTTSAALVEFLDWANVMFKKEGKSFLKESGDEELQEASCYMQAEDFVEEMEEDLYESEDGFDDDDDDDDDNDAGDVMSDNISPVVE